jgi:zinc transport system substrate-binding protein
MKHVILLAALFLLAAPVSAQAGPTVFVTVAPQKYFVEKVGMGRVSVHIMVPPGASPHTYEPRPRQMAELAGAAAYFTIGDSFDRTWLERITGASPNMAVVHTAEGVARIPMPAEHADEEHAEAHHGHEGHDEGHGEEHAGHDHEGLDPHIWLDPALVRIQAERIRDGLAKVDPAGAQAYAAGCEAFQRELDDLDREIRAILDPIPAGRRTFLVFHPSWGYFAKAYGLTQAAIEVEGKEPSPRDMARIIAMGKESGARVVFVQPQFSEKSASVIARQIGAEVVRLDPLAEDWADNLRRAARAFAAALN